MNKELSIRCSRVIIRVLTWIVSSQVGASLLSLCQALTDASMVGEGKKGI